MQQSPKSKLPLSAEEEKKKCSNTLDFLFFLPCSVVTAAANYLLCVSAALRFQDRDVYIAEGLITLLLAGLSLCFRRLSSGVMICLLLGDFIACAYIYYELIQGALGDPTSCLVWWR